MSFHGARVALLVLVWVAAACGKADEAKPSEDEGIPVSAEVACAGTISIAMSDGELSCTEGVTAVGGGLYDLVLQAPPATELTLRLPGLENGTYTASDCLTGSVVFDGRLYVAVAEAELPVLHLSREKAVISGDLSGNFCDVSQLPLRCITVSVPSFSATISKSKSDCACTSTSTGSLCQLGVCSAEGCVAQECPGAAAVCGAE